MVLRVLLIGVCLVASACVAAPLPNVWATNSPNQPAVQTRQDDDNQSSDSNEDDSSTTDNQSKIPQPRTEYMGRRIAQTMHYLGAEWLIRDRREREERCSLMLANLGVKPAMTICDMGCGNGYHTLRSVLHERGL